MEVPSLLHQSFKKCVNSNINLKDLNRISLPVYGDFTSNVPVPFNKAINNPSVVAVFPWNRDEICQYKFDVEQRRIRSIKRRLQF
uniref:NS3 n=1 Tax=Culex pipiens densovirus TaxID=185638 RepID=A0A7D3P698_9VIRU|nr:NS3 [Culex pipiens densovirus]